MQVSVKCADGSDRNCFGSIGVDVGDYVTDAYLCTVDVEQDDDGNPAVLIVRPGDEWLKKHADSLDQWVKDSIAENDFFEVQIESMVCGACGSSESYDDEGNNITAV